MIPNYEIGEEAREAKEKKEEERRIQIYKDMETEKRVGDKEGGG